MMIERFVYEKCFPEFPERVGWDTSGWITSLQTVWLKIESTQTVRFMEYLGTHVGVQRRAFVIAIFKHNVRGVTNRW